MYGTSAILKAMPGIVSLAALAAAYTFVIQAHERNMAADLANEKRKEVNSEERRQGQDQ